MAEIKVVGRQEVILVDDDVAKQLEGVRVYKRKGFEGRYIYVVRTPEMTDSRKTKGLIKFLYGRHLQQLKRNNDFRRSNLKNVSSKYFGVYRDSSTGEYKYSFTHEGKRYERGGYRRETDAALAHDRLVKNLGLDRDYLMDIYAEHEDQSNEANHSNEPTPPKAPQDVQDAPTEAQYNEFEKFVKQHMTEIANIMSSEENALNGKSYVILIDQLNDYMNLLLLIEERALQMIDEFIAHSQNTALKLHYYTKFNKA